MIYLQTLKVQFAASHVLDGHPRCGKMHGHTYVVQMTVMGDPDPDTHNLVASEIVMRGALRDALAELDGRHLNDMLPGVIPSVQGVAAWIWERFAIHYKMYEVTVWQDDLAASVRRDR